MARLKYELVLTPAAQRALRFTCDWCGAKPDDYCVLPSGRLMFGGVHGHRTDISMAPYIIRELKELGD